MRKYLVAMIAVIAVLAIALPSFALEVKYGGMFRVRLQSNDNVRDGQDDFVDRTLPDPFAFHDRNGLDDNGNWIDQRLRMFFTFVASENLQVVTKWEADTQWGNETNGALRHGGGDIGADAVNLEMKNAYIDFAIPMTTARATVGVQGITALKGWIFDDDASAAVATAKLAPFNVQLGYIAARNEDVTSTRDNVDDGFLNLEYASGPWKAGLFGFFQNSNEVDRNNQDAGHTVSTIDPGLIGNTTQAHGLVPGFGGRFGNAVGFNAGAFNAANNYLDFINALGGNPAPAANIPLGSVADGQKFWDLGLNLEYKLPWLSAYVSFIKNFGEFERGDVITGLVDGFGRSLNVNENYDGWMVDAGANLYCGPWTFTLSGFVTSGGDITDPDDFNKFFRYPEGASHYWSEILGVGTLDSNAGETTFDRNNFNMGYSSGDRPSNLWTIQAGAAYQLLKGTKLTLNYWYIGTVEDAVSDATPFFRAGAAAAMADFRKDDSVGHELDFYLDQKVVEGLNLRLVGAYLFANDAYTIFPDDDDAYEVGAQLQWNF